MRVLITGINGFIGAHMANKFMDMGHEVIGIDRTTSKGDIKVYDVDMLSGDIAAVLDDVKAELIIHCAGLANVAYSMDHPEEDFKANTTMVYRLLEGMRQCGLITSRFILLSSAAVYGQPDRLPIRESDELKPMSPYALHKKMAEEICLYYEKNYNFNIRILRIFSAYGSGLKKQIFWDMYQKIKKNGYMELFGTGEESRDYIYIDDLVEVISLIALDDKSDYVVWNVANGKEVFIKDIANIFAKRMNIDPKLVRFTGKIREGDPVNWCADISRIREIGYVSKTSIEEGLERYLEWVKVM